MQAQVYAAGNTIKIPRGHELVDRESEHQVAYKKVVVCIIAHRQYQFLEDHNIASNTTQTQ